jgi:cell division protein ZapE
VNESSRGEPVTSLDEMVRRVADRPRIESVLSGFTPPGRFASKRFENYHPRHATQAAAEARLREVALELSRARTGGFIGRFAHTLRPRSSLSGIYLDGGFGVGKTHLLAALWSVSPAPRAYLSFDELMYFIGLVGPVAAAESLDGYALLAVDEWELDDPGNLKMALAFLRHLLRGRVYVAVTSNTLPLELGEGRFSQKDFRAEVEELASAFEVVRIEGEDYRHRHFEADPGREYFMDSGGLDRVTRNGSPGVMRASFVELLAALNRVHPIRYADLVEHFRGLAIEDVEPVRSLPDALRWVHFVDSLYDSGVPLVASASVPLGQLFPAEFVSGPYGKKVSRCLSRMEELLAESQRLGTGTPGRPPTPERSW